MNNLTRGRALLAGTLLLAACGRTVGGPGGGPGGNLPTLVQLQPASVTPSPSPPAPPVARFSLEEAIALAQANIQVPVVVPDPLPAGAVVVDAGSGFIRFAFGEDGYLDLTYGRTMFDGCGADSAVPVRIGKQPGLVNDFFEWAYVIWPATPAHPEGRYGVAASLDVDAVLALARSMEGALARLRMVEHNC